MLAFFAEGEWLIYHIAVGYWVLGLLCFRLAWGFVGPRFARIDDFVHGPIKVLRYLVAALSASWATIPRAVRRTPTKTVLKRWRPRTAFLPI